MLSELKKNKKIYFAAMPIGDLNDISLEAISLLHSVDLIICEDTRKIKYVINYHKINCNAKYFVVNKFNENKESTLNLLLKKISESETIIWVSDAGYPLVCDPGYKIRKELERWYEFKVVSGPSSIMHALLLSGFPIYPFYFGGFLSNKIISQKNQLIDIKNKINCTIVLFESVHRILKLLNNILEVFGDIKISICREISKEYESIHSDNVSKLLVEGVITLKGEFVVVFNNN